MEKKLQYFIFLLITCSICYAKNVQLGSQLKTFEQTLAAADLQFIFPKEFREINTIQHSNVSVNYAMELPKADFQVWFSVKNLQQEWSKFKASEDESKHALINPDSLYSATSLSAAIALAGKDNYTSKNLPQEVLNNFHADKGKSYQLNLYNASATGHYQYGLLVCLQKSGTGYISMLFLSNENGPDFYKKVNKAYYSVKFN